MKIEEALKTSNFKSSTHKAQLNVLYSAFWLKNKIHQGLKPFHITMEQFNVLRIVRGKFPEGIWVKDISSRMIEPNSNTTRIIDRLTEKGLLVRKTCFDDGRARMIQITEKGLALLADIENAWTSLDPHHSFLQCEEAEALSDLLDKMRGD